MVRKTHEVVVQIKVKMNGFIREEQEPAGLERKGSVRIKKVRNGKRKGIKVLLFSCKIVPLGFILFYGVVTNYYSSFLP